MDIKKLKLILNGYEENVESYVLGPDGVDYEIFHVEQEQDTKKLILAIRKIVKPMDPMRETVRAVIKSLVISSDLGVIDKQTLANALGDYTMLHPSTRPISQMEALKKFTSTLHGEQLAEDIFNEVYRAE